ncbi:MAG: ATP-dependent zinc metalloprotease FtsH [Oscillospiraceae bacterium]|nr:ATP-dependent zinc metalloprotease FtsH [Oscillospiraceae bacterium]
MKKTEPKDILFYLVIVIIIIVMISLIYNAQKPQAPLYSEVIRLFEQQKVREFEIKGTTLTLILGDGSKVIHELYDVNYFREDLNGIIRDQFANGTIEKYEINTGWVPPWWMTFIPTILLVVIFVALWYFMFNRSMGGGDRAISFKRANARMASDEKKKVTFADVEGAHEEKEELREIVDFLKSPKRFVEIGARIPKGVLLVGPPGTGKTLLAKAVAGEAGVQFLSISGSDFVELYVGVGASRVRSLFEEAKKVAPSIIFIDEIDAVGRHRGAGLGGGHDEREQTLNQLLVEMDGFGSNEGVIIIAATNRPDILDPALLRPGRFDRQVYVGIPDIRGREAILKLHGKNKPFDETVNLNIIAKTTVGFTGADLENLLNEAALLAARRTKRVIGMAELEDAMIKVIAGPEKRSKVVPEHDKKLVAFHEAGHAVVSRNLLHHDPLHQISIIPRGVAGGMNIFLPKEDKSFVSKNEMLDKIVSMLGGRVSEKLMLNDISTGASNDIQRATAIARDMVTKYGMSDKVGPINFGSENEEVFIGRDYSQKRNISEQSAALLDSEIKAIIDEAYIRAEAILVRHKDKLTAVAEYLLENETMDSDEFARVFDDDPGSPGGGQQNLFGGLGDTAGREPSYA